MCVCLGARARTHTHTHTHTFNEMQKLSLPRYLNNTNIILSTDFGGVPESEHSVVSAVLQLVWVTQSGFEYQCWSWACLPAHRLLATPTLPCSVGHDLLRYLPVSEVSGDWMVEEGRCKGTSPSPTESVFLHPPRAATLGWLHFLRSSNYASFPRRGMGLSSGAYIWVSSIPFFLLSFSTIQ